MYHNNVLSVHNESITHATLNDTSAYIRKYFLVKITFYNKQPHTYLFLRTSSFQALSSLQRARENMNTVGYI